MDASSRARRVRAIALAGLAVVLMVSAACAGLARTPTPVPPTPTPRPTATPTPSVPDPRTDPLGALLYSSFPGRLRSASFAYDMSLAVEPADDASARALGALAAVLDGSQMRMSGEGAMEVTDPVTGKGNLRMELDMRVMGQETALDLVMVDDQVWTRMGGKGSWQKTEVPAGARPQEIPAGLDPEGMLDMLRKATQVEYLGREQLEGEMVHHLRFKVDPRALDLQSSMQSLVGSLPGLSKEDVDAMLESMVMDAQAWLAPDDLPRRQDVRIELSMPAPEQLKAPEASLRVVMDMSLRLSDLNQPATIEPPVE